MNLNDDPLHDHAPSSGPSAKQQIASDELRVARERLHSEIDGVLTALKRAWLVERKVIGLVIFDAGYRAACYAALALAGLLTLLVATLLLLAGARHGLRVWTDGAWWSDVVLAVVLIGILAAVAHGVRRTVHRSTLATTHRMLSETPAVGSRPTPGTVT